MQVVAVFDSVVRHALPTRKKGLQVSTKMEIAGKKSTKAAAIVHKYRRKEDHQRSSEAKCTLFLHLLSAADVSG